MVRIISVNNWLLLEFLPLEKHLYLFPFDAKLLEEGDLFDVPRIWRAWCLIYNGQ